MKEMYHRQFDNLQKQVSINTSQYSGSEGSPNLLGKASSEEQKEESLYDKMQRNSYLIKKLNNLREMLNLAVVQKDKEAEALTREQMKRADKEFQKVAQNITAEIVGHFVYFLNVSSSELPIIFFIKDFRQQTNEVILRRLFDQNMILLDEKITTTVNNRAVAVEGAFLTNYTLLMKNEEDALKTNLASNQKAYTLIVKYQTGYQEDEDEAYCMPVEILRGDGQAINVMDYDIRWDKKKNADITEIRNLQYGAIKYQASRVDQDCGYVLGSRAQIYTNEFKEGMLNIIHVHVNDTSDQVTVEVEYMADEQQISDFNEFKSDISGQMLRYKIIVKDQSIYRMLYNQGNGSIVEIPFEEHRVNTGQIMVLPQVSDQAQPTFHKIDNVPICMVASKDKEKLSGILQGHTKYNINGFCQERCFERLPGLVDIQVITQVHISEEGQQHIQLLDTPMAKAVPICRLRHADDLQEKILSSLIDSTKLQHTNEIKKAIEVFEHLLHHIEEDKEVAKELPRMEDALSKLQMQESSLEQIVEARAGDIEEHDRASIAQLTNRSGILKRRFATESRFMRMRGKQ